MTNLDPVAQANMAWIYAGEVKSAATDTVHYKIGESLAYMSLAIREIAERQAALIQLQATLAAKLPKS